MYLFFCSCSCDKGIAVVIQRADIWSVFSKLRLLYDNFHADDFTKTLTLFKKYIINNKNKKNYKFPYKVLLVFFLFGICLQ